MPPNSQVLAVFIGGAIGSVCRFLASVFFGAWLGTSFPWGTLFVNVAGSLWLGFIGTVSIHKPGSIDPLTRMLLTTGFAGGFTTFSTFTFETLALYERGDAQMALVNIGANLVIGFLAVWFGAVLARLL